MKPSVKPPPKPKPLTSRTALLLLLVCGALLLALGFWQLMAGPVQAAETTAATDPDHEILVMLRMPPEHFSPDTSYGGAYGGGDARGARRRFAQQRAQANGLDLVGDWPMPLLGLDCYIMRVPDGTTPQDAAAALSQDPGIAWAQPLNTYRAQGAAPVVAATAASGADPLYRVQPDAREWRLDALHRLATGRHVRIAIIDSAIERRHPDLLGQVVLSQNFVSGVPPAAELHGTGVAGIIAAVPGNGQGIVGVAPGARLLALRACWQKDAGLTLCDSLSLAKALYFAVDNRADVINMSLSGPSDPLLGALIDLAQARGITVVGAVDPTLPEGGFPASHPGVVAVVTEGGPPGNPGNTTYAAPGNDIPTTQPGGRWYFVSGSSFAAAHVSGLFALMRETSGKPQRASALATLVGSDTIDPATTLAHLQAHP